MKYDPPVNNILFDLGTVFLSSPMFASYGSNFRLDIHLYITFSSFLFRHEFVVVYLFPQMKFDAVRMEHLLRGVVREALTGRDYDPVGSKTLCQELSMTILDRVKTDQKASSVRRYKYVVMVSIGSVTEQPGVQFSSRSLWNATTDDFVSIDYVDETKYAVVVVYAVYFE